MRLKSELYKNEQIQIMNQIIDIIQLDNDNGFILYKLDNDSGRIRWFKFMCNFIYNIIWQMTSVSSLWQ